MHGLLFVSSGAAAAEDKHLLPVGRGAELDLQFFPDLLPVVFHQLPLELLKQALGRADDVAALARLEELKVVLTDHPSVDHPDAIGPSVSAFHRGDDVLKRRHVAAVAGEDLIAQWHAAAADHQPDAHLLAVAAMVAAVPASSLGIAVGLALEERAGHVVEQKVVVQFEQLAQAVLEVRLERVLVRQELIHRPVQPLLIDLLGRHAHQVGHGRLAIEVLGDVQFAGGFAKAAQDKNLRHHRPGNLFLPRRQNPSQKLRQPQLSQKLPPQPRAAELQAPLHMHSSSVHHHPLRGRLRFVQPPLDLLRAVGHMLDSHASLDVHLSQIRHHLLPRTPPGSYRLDQRPVRVTLAVLCAIAWPNEHAPIVPTPGTASTG